MGTVAVATVLLAPVALPLLAVLDLLRLKRRLPMARLYSFAVLWSWLELGGVAAAGALWITGRARDLRAHYRLQAWWADKVMWALRVTCDLRPQVRGADQLGPGPTVLLVRHASLADSLLTAWVATHLAGMRPRVVMKKELLVDPCLDIVGNRLPNTFVDRSAADSEPELAAISSMARDLGGGDLAVLFPEGTRSNPAKRKRALESIARRDPQRAERMSGLQHLLPPRPAGAATLVATAAGARICVGWHTGFEGLDTFSGILAALGRPHNPVSIEFREADPPPAPSPGAARVVLDPTEAFVSWLDELWSQLDASVDEQLRAAPGRRAGRGA
ncbi:MAG: 1-acyl-sn-glycerol-3-phosphate acyltransferase [Microthrixaceae bacterium]